MFMFEEFFNNVTLCKKGNYNERIDFFFDCMVDAIEHYSKKKEIPSTEYSDKFMQIAIKQRYSGYSRSILANKFIEYAAAKPIQKDMAFFAVKYLVSELYTDKEIGEIFGYSNQIVGRHIKTAQLEIVRASRRLQE